MHLFLTNDDGIYAEGIRQLCAAAVAAGHKVTVCAPDRECSAVSHALTVIDPLRAAPIDLPGATAFAINGRPADCAKLGLAHLVDSPVDMVISGINRGANLGINCVYSGTVGAAIEGAMLGYPSLATSFASFSSPDYAVPAAVTLRVAEWLAEHPLPEGSILNLNVPKLPLGDIRGLVRAPLARKLYHASLYEKRTAPVGYDYYLLADCPIEEYDDPDCDAARIAGGYATLTQLTWDMTCRKPAHQVPIDLLGG